MAHFEMNNPNRHEIVPADELSTHLSALIEECVAEIHSIELFFEKVFLREGRDKASNEVIEDNFEVIQNLDLIAQILVDVISSLNLLSEAISQKSPGVRRSSLMLCLKLERIQLMIAHEGSQDRVSTDKINGDFDAF